jgi:hypothetical protein
MYFGSLWSFPTVGGKGFPATFSSIETFAIMILYSVQQRRNRKKCIQGKVIKVGQKLTNGFEYGSQTVRQGVLFCLFFN